jgi:hypothetical protein
MQEIGFAVHKDGLVPPLEHVPHTPMMPVEPLGVNPIELTHAPGEIRLRTLENQVIQVIVVGHQAIGITNTPRASAGRLR